MKVPNRFAAVNSLAIACLLGLAYIFMFGKNNYLELRDLNAKLEAQKSENASMKTRNDKLLRQVVTYKGSDEAVEAIARTELGLIKEGEIFYQIVEVEEAENDSF